MKSIIACVVFSLIFITGHGLEPHRRRHSGYSRVPARTEKPSSRSAVNSASSALYKVIEHKNYDELAVVDQGCYVEDCGAGRQCVRGANGEEKCICAAPGTCSPGHKLVCGSDGNLYESHCELHRTACERGQRIAVDREGEACFQRDLLEKQLQESRRDGHVMSKKKDLSQSQVPVAGAVLPTVKAAVDRKPAEICSPTLLKEFKHLLKIYHCNRLAITNCDNQDGSVIRKLMGRMFSYYDRDSDSALSRQELEYSQGSDHLEKLAHVCRLTDLIPDSAGSSKLDLTQFYMEFGVDWRDSFNNTVAYEGHMKVTYVTSDGYNGAELTCSLPGTVAWMRNGHDIEFSIANSISLLSGNRLFITAVKLDQTGNYTCYDTKEPQLRLSQLLLVQVKPVVRSNELGAVLEGVTTGLRCHVDGVPQPTVQWQVSQYDLPFDKKRYSRGNEKTTVNILNPRVKLDSAQYQCVAKSPISWSVATTGVQIFVKEEYAKNADRPSKGEFLVLHGSGYTTYETEHCYTTHSVDKHASDFTQNLRGTGNTLQRLCPQVESCEWGMAVNVKDKLVYASQPGLNRLVIIDVLNNFRPKHVVVMEHRVQSLHYMAALDELWILIGNQIQFQTVMILSRASKADQLELTPLLRQHTIFDSVEALFAPQLTAFNTVSRYAYTSHFNRHGLSRIDTVTMVYDSSLDLSNWNCSPADLHHLAIGGLALVECDRNGANLLLDTITNKIISQFTTGKILVSPNTRYIVTSTKPDQITVHYLHDNATISVLYKHTVQIVIDEVRFMESKYSAGYDLAITSPDGNTVLFMDLKTTKTDELEGLLSGRTKTVATGSAAKLVAVSGEFGEHIMVPSQGAMFVINKQYHMIACEWTEIPKYQVTIWVDV